MTFSNDTPNTARIEMKADKNATGGGMCTRAYSDANKTTSEAMNELCCSAGVLDSAMRLKETWKSSGSTLQG
jgi:hypothetical protein